MAIAIIDSNICVAARHATIFFLLSITMQQSGQMGGKVQTRLAPGVDGVDLTVDFNCWRRWRGWRGEEPGLACGALEASRRGGLEAAGVEPWRRPGVEASGGGGEGGGRRRGGRPEERAATGGQGAAGGEGGARVRG